ncbi:GntR family transcriptional regulator [Marinimicrococcus flavescens]|uniref:GntR family transcriptional regulator n=1 Tax=Marinimicrococcus flavescens TaxID=3031815 RepID=A0AAP3XRR6_9PROT|nr:GntR family transcriptional regulator [Marinimicrococcus flavescens]
MRDTALFDGFDPADYDNAPAGAADKDEPMSARAYRVLREALLSGAFPPGALLHTRPIAAQFGMSTMPVREALALLRADGALETLPNRAFRVPFLSLATYREVLLMRVRLETAAGERAAVLATYEDLRAVSEIYRGMVEAEQGPLERYLRLHRRFHFAIYAIAGLPVLQSVIDSLWLRVGPLLSASSRERMAVDRNHHGAILAALETADCAAVSEALRADIADGLEPVGEYLAAQAAAP